jgi:predicted anti-sigma-YlaC factor YlaD
MAYHSAEFSIAGVNTANTSLLNLKATSTRSLSVMEFGISYTVLSTTAYDLGLVRMNAVGTGAITSTAGAPHVAYTSEAAVGVLERYGLRLDLRGLVLDSVV